MAPISPFISWIMVLKGMAFLARSSPAAENSRTSEEFRQSSASFQLKRDRSSKNGIFMNCDGIQVTHK
jgi:hypothetical protein